MSYANLFKREKAGYLVPRSTKTGYKCENVLTTDVLPLPQLEEFVKLMREVPEQFPDSWFLHANISGNPSDVIRYVPTVINSFNRSRPLRRMKISGLRVCNYLLHKLRPYYATDMVITSAFGAVLFMASLLKYYTDFPDYAIISLRAGYDRKIQSTARAVHEDVYDRYWKRSTLPKHYMRIVPDLGDRFKLGYVQWKIISKDIISSVWSIIETVPDDITGVQIGSVDISRNLHIDTSEYCVRPIDHAIQSLRYRRFSAFGCFHNNSKYLLY